MKIFVKSLFLILFCLLILPLSLTAQDDFEDDNLQLEDPPKALLVDPPKDASTIQAANDIWYSNNGSDRYIDLWWSVQHSCFWGGTVHIWVYENGAQIYYWTGGSAWLTIWYNDPAWTFTLGPNSSRTYQVVRRSVALGCDSWWSKEVIASTVPLKAPVNVTATNPNNSDKFMYLSWQNGSQNPVSQYNIYKSGNYIATVSGLSYTVNNIPDKNSNQTFEWKVQAVYGSHTALSGGINETVYQYKAPYSLTASRDIIPGKVHLSWASESDYATHFRIYRNGQLLDTVPESQKTYDDETALPRASYQYEVAAYNINDDFESLWSNEAFGSIGYLIATDGTKTGKVQLSWNDYNQHNSDPTPFFDDLFLFRDGIEILPPFNATNGHNDFEAVPGMIHKYTIKLVKNIDTVLTVSDYGFTPANGEIHGKVTTSTLIGVPNVEVRTSPTTENLSSALSFDGVDDYVSVSALNLNSNTVTMSAWIKRNGNQADWAGIVFSRAKSTIAGLYIMANGELRYNWTNNSAAYGWSSGLIVPDNEWSFVNLVIEPHQATIYLNDTLAVNSLDHNMEQFDGKLDIGRDNTGSDRYFKGLIDEICVWNTVHNYDQIMANKHHIYAGDEDNLVAYWRFNMGSGSVAGDYAAGGNHHGAIMGQAIWVEETPALWQFDISGDVTGTGGDFHIYNIFWGDGTDFTIMPFKKGHGFKPDSLVLPFNNNKYIYEMQDEIRFVDTTSIAVSGFVYHLFNPPCPVPGVEILLDDNPTMMYSDSSGTFAVTMGEAGTYKLTPSYYDHKFIPADTTIEVTDAITDLVFWDTTTATLSGKVAGGCDNFLGITDINLKSLVSDCIDTTFKTDANGYYQITLPAQAYVARIMEIDHPDRVTILNYFTPDTIDVTQQDLTLDFIYHSQPIMSINGLPDPGCGAFNVPVVNQEDGFRLTIDITEKYGDLECPVDSGLVVTIDEVAYTRVEQMLELENGSTQYDVIPGYPNLSGGGAHPYQKMLVIKADVHKYTVTDTIWILVLGQKPREFQFSTVSPEIPLMILRDPPGDQSYSYLSTTTSSSVNIGFSFEQELTVGLFVNFKVGGGGDIPGVGATGAWVGGSAEASLGVRSTLEGSQEIKISTTEMLKTSDSDIITGADGDLYMGAAINILYAKTDILEYDDINCTVARDTGIVWNGDGFKTTYLYTESHILESVIPGLQTMADILNSSGEDIKMDSAEVLLNQMDVWQQVLDYNDSLKQNAQPLPQFPDNISFSSGGSISQEATVNSTTTLSVGLNLFINSEVALSIGAKAGDFNQAEGGVKISAKLEIGISESITYEISNTIGFELADDDELPPGDAFTVDILGDPVYGTPVFNLLSGTSSCPWEHPTLPREGVGLTMNVFELDNIPPEIPASFDLYLYNLSQNDETRTYLLSLIQGSNPDGAIIQVGGAVLGDDELSFTMPPNRDDPQKATLRVQREVGSVYDYENLQLHLYSACDAQIDTTVSFSVHFIKPCSDVSIVQPTNNWILNSNSDSVLVIVLKDYDASNQQMTEVKCEYRRVGVNDWTELFSYTRAQLPPDSIRYDWDMSTIDQDAYELRASTHCPAGIFYTRTHRGDCDFEAPIVFGNPQPADGSLDTGDEIEIEFNEPIDCATASKENIAMINITKQVTVNIEIVCAEDRLIISAKNPAEMIERDSMRVIISSLSDLYGNIIEDAVTWEFMVNIITLVADDAEPKIPTEFALDQNYPNPFNPETTIRFAIPIAMDVELIIYDVTGQVVMQPVKKRLVPGYYNFTFNGQQLSSGIYFYHLKAGKFKQTKKLILLK